MLQGLLDVLDLAATKFRPAGRPIEQLAIPHPSAAYLQLQETSNWD
jgi:hypothetical protein